MAQRLVIGLLLIGALLFVGCGDDGGNGGLPPTEPSPYLTWDPNQEPDLAGYVVYWGPEPGVYTHALDVELDRIVYLSTIQTYDVTYFAVTAYDTSGNESDFSEEIRWP